MNLEQSLALFERGNVLADLCQGFLDGARARVEAARPTLTPRRTGRPDPGLRTEPGTIRSVGRSPGYQAGRQCLQLGPVR